MLSEELKNIKTGEKELRKFGLTMAIVLGLLGAGFLWRERACAPYFLILFAIFLALGLGLPRALKPIYKTWMTLATLMGWFVTRVILCVLFYLVVTPIGLISKLSGKQFLALKMDKVQNSYWNYREPKEFTKADCEKQF